MFERAHRLEAAQYADGAVVHAGVRDGIGVRAGGYGGQIGLGADPADEDVADGIVADFEALSHRKFFQPCARTEIVGGEDDARDSGAILCWLSIGERSEGLELAEQSRLVDLNLHGSNSLTSVDVGSKMATLD